MGAAEDAMFNHDIIIAHLSKTSLLIIQTWSNLAYMFDTQSPLPQYGQCRQQLPEQQKLYVI